MAPGWSDEEDSFFPHWFFYGYPKRKEPEWKRDEKLTKKEDKDKKLLTGILEPVPVHMLTKLVSWHTKNGTLLFSGL